MRPTARKLLANLVQEAFSYELSLNRPVDPISGSNATIEQNPAAVKELLEAEEGRRLLDDAYAKMSVYAKYEFKTPVGHHGLVNSAATGGGLLTAMEALELDPVGPNVNFETLLSTNETVQRAWQSGAIKEGLSDQNYENAVTALNREYFSYLDLTCDFNRRTFELYLDWGKLFTEDPFKTLVSEWDGLDGDGRETRLTALCRLIEDRLDDIKEATPIWRADISVDQLEDSFTTRHGVILETLNEYQNTSPFISFFKESSEALVAVLKEHDYDAAVVEVFQGFARRFQELSDRLFARDYLDDAKRFHEGGRALLRAHLLKRFGGVQVSQEGLDDLYYLIAGKPPTSRHTALPLREQRIDGIVNELDSIFAATMNLGLDDKEQALVEEIYHSETFGKSFLSGKWDCLKEYDAVRYNGIAISFRHHQTENGTFYDRLKQYIDNKGKDLELTRSLLDWLDGAMASNETAVKAVEQFDTGHVEFSTPCFELCQKAYERAKKVSGFEDVCNIKVSELKASDEATALKFEQLAEEQRENGDVLYSRFVGSRSIEKVDAWLNNEIAAVGQMGTYDAMNRRAGGEGVKTELTKYIRFLTGARDCIKINKNIFGAMACSVRNIVRSRIILIDIIFKARAGEFTMEELDDQEVKRLLSEGVTISQEGFPDLVRRLFGTKREKPEQALERLEGIATGWKNPIARALVEGTTETLPALLAEELVKISEDKFAPCQWRSKELKSFSDFYADASHTLRERGETFHRAVKEAKDRKQLESVLTEARNDINTHLAMAKKYKMTLDHKPTYVKVPAEELYLDLTKRLPESVKFVEQLKGRYGYSLVHDTQYYGWFFTTLKNQDSAAFEDYSEDEINQIVKEFSNLEEEFENLFDWQNVPDNDVSDFIKQGRLLLLQTAEAIEVGKGDSVAMEGLVTKIIDFIRGRKPAPSGAEAVTTSEETTGLRPDRLGFGYDEATEFAEKFIADTKGKGGELDIQALTGDRFTIPANILKKPHSNKQMILQWFDTNCPENKGKVEMFYKAFEERVGADTCVLPLWLTSKETRLLRAWSALGKAFAKYPWRDPSQSDVAGYKKLWETAGLTELVMRAMKVESLSEVGYREFLGTLFQGAREIDKTQYEKAALGVNCLYSQIGSFTVARHWGTAELLGEENYYCSRLLGKAEDKYCQVEYEWTSTLEDLMILAWHIGNLSGKRA